jgi:16S rRNA (cytidine1402-2'-O)-methyltransferase
MTPTFPCLLVVAQGHPDIRANDPARLEILDSHEWAAHPGTIGYLARYDPGAMAALRGRVNVHLRVGEVLDAFEATISPWWQRSGSLVFRRDTQFRSKDFAAHSSKAAADLRPELLDALRAPSAQLECRITRILEVSMPPGALAVVALPIGNQADLSPRALEILSTADMIFAEDTRVAESLLRWRGVRTPIVSCHDHNEHSRTDLAARSLARGERIALVSDAGFPLVSDPGYAVVQTALQIGAQVLCIPGPSAVIAAIVLSGLPATQFCFRGFVPRRGQRRATVLAALRSAVETTVLFESPRRLEDLLSEIASVAPGRAVAVCRDMTKESEAVFRDTVENLASRFAASGDLAGEFTVVVAPAEQRIEPISGSTDLDEFLLALLRNGCPVRPIVASLRDTQGVSRDDAYARVQQLKSDRARDGASYDE